MANSYQYVYSHFLFSIEKIHDSGAVWRCVGDIHGDDNFVFTRILPSLPQAEDPHQRLKLLTPGEFRSAGI